MGKPPDITIFTADDPGFRRALTAVPDFAWLLGYWDSHRDTGGTVQRAAIQAFDIPASLLPHTFLYEKRSDGRFWCRLSGTAIVTTVGYEPTGKSLDDLLPKNAVSSRTRLSERVLSAREPVLYAGYLAVKDYIPFIRLLLPLWNGLEASFVFGAVVFRQVPDIQLAPGATMADPLDETTASRTLLAGWTPTSA